MRASCGVVFFVCALMLVLVSLCRAQEMRGEDSISKDVNVKSVKMLTTNPSLLEGEWYTVAVSAAASVRNGHISPLLKDLVPPRLVELLARCPCLVTNISRVVPTSGGQHPKTIKSEPEGKEKEKEGKEEEKFHADYFCQGDPEHVFRSLITPVSERPGLFEMKLTRHKRRSCGCPSNRGEIPEENEEMEEEKEEKGGIGFKTETEKESGIGEKVEEGKQKEKEKEKEKEEGKEKEENTEKGKEQTKKGKPATFYVLDFVEGAANAEHVQGGPSRALMLAASSSSKEIVWIKSRSLPVSKEQLEPLLRYAHEHGFAPLQLTRCRSTTPSRPARD